MKLHIQNTLSWLSGLHTSWLFWLQISTLSVFAGRAWQHLVWDAPLRDLLWDENLMSPVITNLFGITWKAYVTNPMYDQWMQGFIKGVGVFYLLCAIAAWLLPRFKRLAGALLFVGGISLILLAVLEFKEKFYFLAQMLEYALQFGSPFFLLYAFYKKALTPQLIWWMKIAVAIAFSSHGLYAINYYPIPGNFIEMVINVLPINEGQALVFLKIMGVFDFVISVFIFLPWRYFQIAGLAYAVFWGAMTTSARLLAYFHFEFALNWFKQWLHECVFRFPHFLIPLLLLSWVLSRFYSRNPTDTTSDLPSLGQIPGPG